MQSGPLVVDTYELGRRPGNERTYHLSVEAPVRLGYDVYGVAEGSELDIELRLEAVMDGVLATGTASARATGECVRCLDDVEEDLDVDFQELYLYDRPSSQEEADDVVALEGDLLDLEPVLTDAVVFALPLHPLCGPECPGLCPDCGARLADDPDHTHGEPIDPRWTALTRLTEQPEE
ncbi:putative ACR, COG1399 [Aeromicrobium marinum DSM 15272]|uniref:ACR, COG1399 n=1 Tax=Aeromicrobium marinum DSM 15272 TaxID=585531 RepID=E2SAY8_9ACTN|nr:putative ACR, COG1399 [Aeromicrobium marinum DSM 15272]